MKLLGLKGLIAGILFMLMSFSAFAGGSDGGSGGKGVVCRHFWGGIKSVELLDLWEARVLYGRQIVYSNDPVEKQLAESMQRMKNLVAFPWDVSVGGKNLPPADGFVEQMRIPAAKILENYQDVRRLRGVRLTLTQDSYEDAFPEGCAVEQIVQYKDIRGAGDSPAVLINQDLFNRMNLTNRAALALHEGLYAVMREFGERTSVRVRRAVGYVMSGGTFRSLKSILAARHISCESEISKRSWDLTRVHLVEVDGVIHVIPEAVNGSLMMAFPDPSLIGGIRMTIDQAFERLSDGSFVHTIDLVHSLVDFDSKMLFTSIKYETDDRGPYLRLSQAPSGIPTPYRSPGLNCRIVPAQE